MSCFEDLSLSHAELFKKYAVVDENRLGWETEFAVLWSWNVNNNAQIAVVDGGFVIRAFYFDKTVYYPPYVSPEHYPAALELIKKECRKNGTPVTIVGIPEIDLVHFKNFQIIPPERDSNDYIYLVDDLKTLVGKKFHSKRNFVTRFFKTYAAEFRAYTDNDFDIVMKMENEWREHTAAHRVAEIENAAIERALKYHKELDLKIGLLFADDKLSAFSISSVTNSTVGHTLFEKADTSFVGAYQTVNKCVANEFFDGVKYVNRQEDMGLDGLRKVKLSYHPVKLVEKYVATLK